MPGRAGARRRLPAARVARASALAFARTLGHVLFLFLTASVIAFTLNPLVRDLTRLRLPRGLSVAVVSVIFATAFIGLLVALGTVVVSETRSAAERIDEYLTEESPVTGQTGVEVDVDKLKEMVHVKDDDIKALERDLAMKGAKR